MIDLDIDDPEQKNKIEHEHLEREIDKLREEISRLKTIVMFIKEAP